MARRRAPTSSTANRKTDCGDAARGLEGPTLSDPDTIRREYDRLAPDYDRRWSFYISATLRETATRLEAPPNGRLLDVGCGTGALLRALKERVPNATLAGLDPSVGMLEVAHRRLGRNASLVQGWAERLPFADAAFDTVVSMNALHYFPDPAAALAEMRRVVRPGGHAVITDWCDDFLACRLCDLWLRRFDPAHVRTYGSYDLRRMLSAAGFRLTALERYKISWLWGLMTASVIPA